MKKTILLKIKYDGSVFSGWQRQPNVRTVQGVLEDVISGVLGETITLKGCSRTDAGVHALGQLATFEADLKLPLSSLPRVINNSLNKTIGGSHRVADIYIEDATIEAPDFDIHEAVKAKKYRYIIETANHPDIFRRNRVMYVDAPLNTDEMMRGGNMFRGEHDFAGFQSAGGTPRKTTVRTIYSVDIYKRDEEHVIIDVLGNGFLYNMVRIMVGTLIEIGMGKRKASEIREIIEAKDRNKAGPTAPPQGLYLVKVYMEMPDVAY